MVTRNLWTLTALMLGVVAVYGACRAEGAAGPARMLAVQPVAAYGEDTTRLTVTLSDPSGDGFFDAAGWYDVTATVSGGNGTYKYFWKSRWCTTDPKECSSTYWAFSTSDSLSATVSYHATQYDYKAWIVVQVQETSGNGRTGTDTIMVEGPADIPEPPASGGSMNCTAGSLGFPFREDSVVAGVVVKTKYFRRNPCTYAKVYQP